MITNKYLLSDNYKFVSTENKILSENDESRLSKAKPWSSTLSLSCSNTPPFSINLTSRLKSNLIGNDIPLLYNKPISRPPKRALENIHLKSKDVYAANLGRLTKLTSVRNTLLDNESVKPESKVLKLDPKTDLALSTTKAIVLPVNDNELPAYQFDSLPDINENEEGFFGNVELDVYEDIKNLKQVQTSHKIEFLTAVCTSLVNSPNFKNQYDATKENLEQLAAKVETFDPEFILKVALYARQDLNIRSTTNFLLAYSANSKKCRVYLRKYFQKTIRLPSDWLEVAELYQNVEGKEVQRNSIPSTLRKVMVEKFEDFDEYQLAKYNKRKRKKKSDKAETENEDEVVSDNVDQIEEKHVFTLKRMIRLLHISKPHEPVMCLLGKNYPEDPEKFRQSGLSGVWDPERAGKRMKLEVPVTWETQLAEKGNKAKVWQKLLDEKKLPYMAMLRNLRNIILTNVSEKHHQLVLNKISNKKAVMSSGQFPLSFYNAYETIGTLEDIVRKNQRDELVFRSKKGEKDEEAIRRRIIIKKLKNKCDNVDAEKIPLYKKSLEKAMQISVEHNLDPIPGRTLVICDLLSCVSANETNAFKLVNQNLLLSLMCLSACEHCDLKVTKYNATSYDHVKPVKDGSILEEVRRLSSQYVNRDVTSDSLKAFMEHEHVSMLESYLQVEWTNQQPINTIVYFTTNDRKHDGNLKNLEFVQKYRLLRNPKLLYVCVNLSPYKGLVLVNENPLNITFAGSSDQVLKFLAAQGNASQLEYVERIDTKFDLKAVPRGLLNQKWEAAEEELILPSILPPLAWKTIRVFISSTFKDTHGERDLLVRYVFPELRARARKLLLNVHEVDLRWGITVEESKGQKSAELCLTEVSRCHYFLGILGERYGTVPSLDSLPDEPQFDWVRDYPSGASLTELEIFNAALSHPKSARVKSFFYFRDNSFESDVPWKWRKDFLSENETSAEKLRDLKSRIRQGGFEVYDNYPCCWGQETNNVPILTGLESFGQRVLDNLWNAIKKLNDLLEYESEESSPEEIVLNSETFLRRENAYEKCLDAIQKPGSVTLLYGKAGCGKTSFLLDLRNEISQKETCLSCFVSDRKNTSNLSNVMVSLCHSACDQFNLVIPIPKDKLNVETVFWDVMTRAAKRSPTNRLIIILDGLEHLKDEEETKLSWLPQNIDSALRIVLSSNERGLSHETLRERHKLGQIVTFLALDSLPVAQRKDLVTNTLRVHRKTLSNDAFNNQLLLLVTKRDAVLPAYLKLACEQLRMFGNFDQLTAKIKSLPQSLEQLTREILINLEQFHGPSLVESALTLLALSRDGLEEHELAVLIGLRLKYAHNEGIAIADLLNAIASNNNNSKALASIAPSTLSSLCRSIRTVFEISDDASRFSLKDSQILRAVKSRYLGGIGSRSKTILSHKILASYFVSVCDPYLDSTWKGQCARALRAVCHYLVMTPDLYRDFVTRACQFNFVSAAFRLGQIESVMVAMTQILKEDAALNKDKNSNYQVSNWRRKKVQVALDLEALRHYHQFISVTSHINLTSENELTQQALLEPDWSVVYRQAKESLSNRPTYYFELLSKSDRNSACKMIANDFPIDILCCASSPNYSLVALGCSDGVVRLISAQTGKVIRSLISHGEGISSLIFLSNNKICCGSYDASLTVWDVDGAFRICILNGHTRRVTACCLDNAGKNIISASWDATIRLWSAQDGRQLSLMENSKPLTALAVYPEKDIVVTGDFEATLKLWDLEKMKRIAVLRGHSSSIQRVAFIQNGLNIVSGSLLGEIFLWATKTGTLIAKSSTRCTSITNILYDTKNGGNIISSEYNGSVKLWNNMDESPLLCKDVSLLGEGDNGAITILFFLTMDKIALGFSTGLVTINSVAEFKEISRQNLSSPITAIASCKDRLVVAATQSGLIKGTHFAKTKRNRTEWQLNSGVTCLSVNDHVIIAGLVTGEMTAISVQSGSVLCSVQGHDGAALSVHLRMNRDYQSVLTGGADKKIKSWQIIKDKAEIKLIKVVEEAHADWITSANFGNDLIVTGGQDTKVKLWKSEGVFERDLIGLGEAVSSVQVLNGKSKMVIASGIKGNVALWKADGGQLIFSSEGKTRRQLTFHIEEDRGDDNGTPEGKIAYVIDEKLLRINKLFEVSMSCELKGHKGPVTGLALLDNNVLLSASNDQSLRWWDTSVVASKTCHQSPLVALQICHKAYFVLSADIYSLKIWKLNFKENDAPKLEMITAMNFPLPCITAASFVNEDGTGLFLATNLSRENSRVSSVVLYKVVGDELAKRTEVKDLKSEVTSIDWTPPSNQVTLSFKNGQLGYTDVRLDGINLFKSHGDWIMSVKKMDRENTYFFTEIRNGGAYFYKHSYADVANNKQKIRIMGADKELERITTYQVTEDDIIAGDNTGQIQRCKIEFHSVDDSSDNSSSNSWEDDPFGQVYFKKKVHSKDVTGLCICGSFIFTSSLDQSIKVWNSKAFEQVGQLRLHSPISKMAACQKGDKDKIQVIFATSSGEIHLALWSKSPN